jgi:hypothetical protein
MIPRLSHTLARRALARLAASAALSGLPNGASRIAARAAERGVATVRGDLRNTRGGARGVLFFCQLSGAFLSVERCRCSHLEESDDVELEGPRG